MPAIANITKTTAGALSRRVQDIIVSTVTLTNTGTTTSPSTTFADAIPPMAGVTRTWTAVGTGGAVPANASGSGAISEVSAGIPPGGSLVYTINDTTTLAALSPQYQNSASYNDAENPIVSASGPNIQVQDTMTIAYSIIGGVAPRYVGDVIQSTIQVQQLSTAFSEAGIDVVIPLPPGVTRTWTTSFPTGVVSPAYPLSGVGAINLTGRTYGSLSGIQFNIFDTVTAVGTYQLCPDTVRGGTTPPGVTQQNTIPCSGLGAAPIINVLASGSNVQLTKSTAGAGTRNIGDVITSTITITNTGNLAGTPVNLNDAVPVSPSGTTRTWTIVSSGVTPVPPASGVGGVGLVGLTFAPFTSSLTLTVNDTINNSGNYVNNANITGTSAQSTNGQNVSIPSFIITCPANQTLTVGTPASFSVTGMNGTLPYSFSAIGLPAGMSINPSTGVISGTPTTAQPSTAVNVSANDALFNASACSFNITVNAVLVPNTVTTKTTAAGPFTVGQVITSTVTVTNTGTGPQVGYTIVDVIPASPVGTTRSFSSVSSGGATGNTLSGVTGINDTLTLPASSSVTYTINDTTTSSGTYQNIVVPNGGAGIAGGPPINVTPPLSPPTITCPANQTLTVGTFASVTALSAGGTPPKVFSAVGLPAGMSINPATGVISGTPTTAQVSTPVTVTVTDAALLTANCSFNIVVASAPMISDPQITKTTAGGSPRVAGDQIISTVVLSNPAPTATAPATGLLFTDPIPVSPAGTTRTYTSVVTGGATGNTSGAGSISDTVTLPINSTITYTITDTVVLAGSYNNVATLSGEPPASGGSVTVRAATPPLTCDCSPASIAIIQAAICEIQTRLDGCCGNFSAVDAANMQVRLQALTAQLLVCSNSNVPPPTNAFHSILLCDPVTGTPVIANISELTGATTFFLPDGVTPYVGPTPVSCLTTDIEEVESCRDVIVAGAWGAVGDKIKEIRWFDTTNAPPTQVAQVFINETTQAVVVGITAANSSPCGVGSVAYTHKVCDAVNSFAQIVVNNAGLGGLGATFAELGLFPFSTQHAQDPFLDWYLFHPEFETLVRKNAQFQRIDFVGHTPGVYEFQVMVHTESNATLHATVLIAWSGAIITAITPQSVTHSYSVSVFEALARYNSFGTLVDTVNADGTPYVAIGNITFSCPETYQAGDYEWSPETLNNLGQDVPTIDGFLLNNLAPAGNVVQVFSVPVKSVTVAHDGSSVLQIDYTTTGTVVGNLTHYVPAGGANDVGIEGEYILSISITNLGTSAVSNIIVNASVAGN